MTKKYIVSIMDRYYLGDGFFLFNVNHTEIGTIDDKTGLFKDRNGNEYAPMLEPRYLESEITNCYSNILDLKKLPESVGVNTSLQEAVSEFDYLTKQGMYFVGRKSDGEVFCIHMDKASLRQDAEEKLGVKQEEPPEDFESTDEVPDEKGRIVFHSEDGDNIEFTPDQGEEEEYDSEDEMGHMGTLDELQDEIINGRFSKEELQDLLEQLQQNSYDIDNCIQTIQKYVGKEAQPNDVPKEEKEKEEEKPQEEPRIDIEDLYKKVTRTLIAQDLPAKRVITELARKEMNKLKKRKAILLTGSTGVGKTALMSLIARYLDKPFIKIDATQITTAGYVGKDIEESLWDLYVKCGKDVKKAERAIVFFDEIDKKGSDKKSDVGGKGVINSLLPFIEGSTYDACPNMQIKRTKVPINTANMTIVFGGAFADVYKTLIMNNQMGFGGQMYSKEKPQYRKATVQDFVEKGQMSDEFMGRVSIVKLNDLDVEDIKRIMLESDESALKVSEQIFNDMGVKITFTDGYINKVAERALKRKSGARGLDDVIDESTWMAFEEVYTHPGEYEEAIIDEPAIDDPSKYQLVKKIGSQ